MTKVVFIVPVRHPENVKNPYEQRIAFEDLFASFAAQSDKNFTVNLVCNSEQSLPELPVFVTRVNVSFPPNKSLRDAQSRHAAYVSIRADKGLRVRAGLASVEAEKDVLMVCDDDDLIHRRLVEAIVTGDINKVRYIEKGYKWVSGTSTISELIPFHKACGTSLAIPARFYKIFNRRVDEEDAIMELGSHILPFENMKTSGYEFEPIDFFAAAYRVQGENSTQVDVVRATKLDQSGLSRVSRRFGNSVKRLISPFARVDKEASEPVKLEAASWFQDDFLGGRPIEREAAVRR